MLERKEIFNTFSSEGARIHKAVVETIMSWDLELRLEIERPMVSKFGELKRDMSRMICYVVGEKSEIRKLEKIVKAYTLF